MKDPRRPGPSPARNQKGVRGRAMICHYAEAGMDVDKPVQYEIVKRDLEARGRRV